MTIEKTNQQLPPHDLAMEEVLLGALLIDGDQYDHIQPLSAEDFYHEPHGRIYQAMVELVKSGTVIDQLTVADRLNVMNKLEECGGVAYLSHLMSVCPTPLDAVDYAAAIRRMSIARRIIIAGQAIENIGFSNPPDVVKALADCDQQLIDVRRSGVKSPIISPKERGDMLFTRYNELHTSEAVAAIGTGIYKLDRLLGGGFYGGDSIILAGRAGIGKTTFAYNIARHVAKTRNVLIASAEMDVYGLSDREVAQDLGLPIHKVRLGKYDDQMFNSILTAVGNISEEKLWVYDDQPMTTAKILQCAIGMQLRYGLGMLVIDYLGALADHFGKTTYEQVSYISHQTKMIARILGVPVLTLHQVNRENEKREDKRPQLSDLRDSGAIEQDADTVILLYRDSYYAQAGEEGADDWTEIIIAKQRQGQANRFVKVRFDKTTQRYISGDSGETMPPMI